MFKQSGRSDLPLCPTDGATDWWLWFWLSILSCVVVFFSKGYLDDVFLSVAFSLFVPTNREMV